MTWKTRFTRIYDIRPSVRHSSVRPSARHSSVRLSVRHSSVRPYPRFILTPLVIVIEKPFTGMSINKFNSNSIQLHSTWIYTSKLKRCRIVFAYFVSKNYYLVDILSVSFRVKQSILKCLHYLYRIVYHYNDDANTPVYEWVTTVKTFKEVLPILLMQPNPNKTCTGIPTSVSDDVFS